MFRLKNKAIIWFLKNKLERFKFKNSQVKDVILDLFKYKLKCTNLTTFIKTEDKPIENLVIKFSNKTFDFIKLKDIIVNCDNIFPLRKDCNIRIAFSYNKPLKSLICNYNSYSKNLDLIKDEDCHCKQDRYSSYLDPFYGHIVTGNLNIVEDDNLRNFMNFGSKYRLDFNYNRNRILKSFEEDIDIFILKLAYKYVWPVEGFLEWKSEICKAFKSKIIFYDNYFNKNKANYKVNCLFNSIKDLKNKFIISTVDKASNNFCIMYKVFYKKLLMEEYLGNSTYIKITYPYSLSLSLYVHNC